MKCRLVKENVGDRPCVLCYPARVEQPIPLFLCHVGPEAEALFAEVFRFLPKDGPRFALCAVTDVSWDRDYTPWQSSCLPERVFSGGADAYLNFVRSSLAPWAERATPSCARYHLGYSLGGLCALYALTREGRKPPMVDVRRAIYSLLEKQPRRRRTVNLLGYFAPLQDDCEIYDILRGVGFTQINEISRCPDFAAYKAMSQANVNFILNPESRLAAQDMEKRLGIPSVELTRLYQVAQIHKQYQALAQVLGTEIDDSSWHERAQAVVGKMREKYSGTTVAIGEMQNGNAFEMALALTRYGFVIKEIYANLGPDDFVYLRHLAALSPATEVYSNLSPSMLYYQGQDHPVDVTIGKDAAYYHEQAAHLHWDEDIQPFGYAGVISLLQGLDRVLSERKHP